MCNTQILPGGSQFSSHVLCFIKADKKGFIETTDIPD